MRRDVLEPLAVFLAVRARQVGQLQLLAQPAGTRREHALGVFVAEARRCVQRVDGGAQFLVRVMGAVFGEKEALVVDVAAPAAKLGRLVMTEGDPVAVGRQLLQACVIE
ncbi:hypothetical protein D3C76_1249200 [compost metagenome]